MQGEGSLVVGGGEAGKAVNKPERGNGPLRQTDGKREEAGERPGCCKGQSRRECWLPSHVGVQALQALRGVGGGLHAGDWLVEGIASGLLRLDATSSPAFSVQTLGDILQVPSACRVGGECCGAVSWPPPTSAASLPLLERNLGSSRAQKASDPSSLLAFAHAVPSARHSLRLCPLGERSLGKPAWLCLKVDGPPLPPLHSPDAAPALGA